MREGRYVYIAPLGLYGLGVVFPGRPIDGCGRGDRFFGHSRKLCWCGGHNSNNPKSNKRHHGTMVRLRHRMAARSKLASRGD
jgi:hypothetical protein